MRVMSSGDHHFCEHLRFDECVRIHHWMVDVARRERVDVFLSGGDVYEKLSSPLERRAVADWLTAMAEICPVLISRGNHERQFDVELMGRLKTRHPVIVESGAAVYVLGGAAVAAFAWPNRAVIVAASGAKDQETTDVAARDAFRAVLLGLGNELDRHPRLPRILLGHAMIDGSIASTGQPLLGLPLNLGLADLALARPHLGLFAHIHRAQEWDFDGVPYVYTGSPFRTDFGQLEEKSVVLATFDRPLLPNGSWLTHVERIATPATPMVHVEATWRDGAFENEGRGFPMSAERVGAEVRFRYRVAADERQAARAAATDWARELDELGAASVKLEEVVIPTTRARAPEIVTAPTLGAKLEALWNVREDDIGETRRSRLLGKVAVLEEETHAS